MAKYPALDLRFAPGPGAGALRDFLYAELDDFEPVAIQEHESGDEWRVFFRSADARNAARTALLSEFRHALLELSPVDVVDDDWARRSQAALTAVRVGRIVVAPPWDLPSQSATAAAERTAIGDPRSADSDQRPADSIAIIIEPSMGFGTGHHATTRLCLQLLQQIDVSGTSVVDIGTGSGVLAIAAAKLGAARVVAIDNDPDALANARENVERNAVQDVVDVREADLGALEAGTADIALANLTGAVLQRFASNVDRLVRRGGTLIASGFGPDELEDVLGALGGTRIEHIGENEWVAVRLRRA